MPRRPATTSAIVPRFVERRNERRPAFTPRFPMSSAGSTSTDAAASVRTLTAETMPIERSGG